MPCFSHSCLNGWHIFSLTKKNSLPLIEFVIYKKENHKIKNKRSLFWLVIQKNSRDYFVLLHSCINGWSRFPLALTKVLPLISLYIYIYIYIYILVLGMSWSRIKLARCHPKDYGKELQSENTVQTVVMRDSLFSLSGSALTQNLSDGVDKCVHGSSSSATTSHMLYLYATG